jgi:AcrR family transcriptional regulator
LFFRSRHILVGVSGQRNVDTIHISLAEEVGVVYILGRTMTKFPVKRADPPRVSYRHGDLRRALLEAGIALAREGGPAAVVLREATRRAGVVPNAAYRHFASRQDLAEAVRAAALADLAVTMEAELATIDSALSPAEHARGSLRAVGIGYLRYALAEPGLFRTAFAFYEMPEGDTDPAKTGRSGLNPFQLLGATLDQMVATGALDTARRPGAEFLAWSAVHGFAMLILDGPLRSLPQEHIQPLGDRLIEMVEKGL